MSSKLHWFAMTCSFHWFAMAFNFHRLSGTQELVLGGAVGHLRHRGFTREPQRWLILMIMGRSIVDGRFCRSLHVGRSSFRSLPANDEQGTNDDDRYSQDYTNANPGFRSSAKGRVAVCIALCRCCCGLRSGRITTLCSAHVSGWRCARTTSRWCSRRGSRDGLRVGRRFID